MSMGKMCKRLSAVLCSFALIIGCACNSGIQTVYADSNTSVDDAANASPSPGVSDVSPSPDMPDAGADKFGMNEEGTIYTVDLSKAIIADREVAPQLAYTEDGAAVITWSEDCDDWGSVTFLFDGMDLTGWKCVIYAEGDCCALGLEDADRRKPDSDHNYRAITSYHTSFPVKLDFKKDELTGDFDEYGDRIDYKNLGRVTFTKNQEDIEKKLTVYSIKFYKYAHEAPLLVVDNGKTPQDTPVENVPGMNEEGTIYTVDLNHSETSENVRKYERNGSLHVIWDEESRAYSYIRFNFRRMDVSGWTCVLDIEGERTIFQIGDAYRRTDPYDDPLYALLHWDQRYPAIIKLDEWEVGDRVDEYGDPATFAEIGNLTIRKGEQTVRWELTIRSIKFYKNAEDVPKIIQKKNDKPPETPTPKPTVTPAPTSKPTKRPTKAPTGTPTPQATDTLGIAPSEGYQNTPYDILSPESPVRPPLNEKESYRQNLLVKDFAVSSKDGRSVYVTWRRNTDALQYDIYRSAKKHGDYKLIKTVKGSKSSYTDKKVSYRRKHYYKIVATGRCDGSLIQGPHSMARSIYLSGVTTPDISVKKGGSRTLKYIIVNLKRYGGNYVEIYTAHGGRPFRKLKIVSGSIRRYKGKFKIQYIVKNTVIRIKIKTYKQLGKKRYYSKFSNIVNIKV